MATNWKSLLKSLGLSESEAMIYVTSLELGPASVQDLAKKAHVSRVTTYAVIESLAARGLMSSVEKGKKRLFSAESPERLVSVVQTRVKEMEATLHEVQDSLHELKLMQRGEKPIVRMFEGEEAIKAIYEDMISSRPSDVHEFGNLDEIRKFVTSDEVRKQVQSGLKRAKRQAIYITDEVSGGKVEESLEIKHVTSKEVKAYGDLIIYGKKVAVSTFRGKVVSVLIESEEIADTLRGIFKLAWKK